MQNKMFIICLLLPAYISGQPKDKLITIKDPVIDTTDWAFYNRKLQPRTYIRNKNYIIYQSNTSSIILHADVKTFRIPLTYAEKRFAFQKNGVFYDGVFIKADTTGFKNVSGYRNNEK